MTAARSRSRLHLLILGTGLSLSAVLAWTMHEWEEAVDRHAFEIDAQDHHHRLQDAGATPRHALDEILGLFDASEDVNRNEFAQFSERLLRRHPALRACAWCPWIPALQRPGQVEAARRSGQATLAQRLAAGTGDALPVWMLTDDGTFPWPPGTDLLQQDSTARRALLLQAMQNRSEVVLGSQPTTPGTIVIAMPWMKQTACQGVFLVACDLTRLVGNALGSAGQERLHLRLVDEQGALVHGSGTAASVPKLAASHDLVIANRRWTLTLHPNDHLGGPRHLLPLVTGLGGLLLTLALILASRVQRQRSAQTELLVTERTRELREKITEHARSTAALEKALVDNAMLASAVSSTTTGILIIDHGRGGRPIVFINPALTTTYGWTAEDAVGRSVRLLFCPDSDGALCQRLEACMERGEPFRNETILAVKGGGTRWTDLTLTPIHDAGGALRWYVGVLTDIAAQKESAASLQHERDLLQRQLGFAQVLARAAQAVMADDDLHALLRALIDGVGRALAADRITIFDVDFGQRLSTCLTEWTAPGLDTQPVAASFPLELFARSAKHLFRHRTWIVSHDDDPFPTLTADGSASLLHGRYAARSLLFQPFAFRADGFNLLIITQIRDRRTWREDEIQFILALSNLVAVAIEKSRLVAQRRQGEAALRANEARYRAIVEDQSELILRFRPDGAITFANAASCRYWNAVGEGLVGRNFPALLPDSARSDLPRALAGLTPARGVHTCELALPQHEGPPRWLQLTVRVIFDEHQQPVEYQAVCQDITGRHQFEDSLRASEASLRSLISEAPEGIFLCDDIGHILEANPSGCALFGGSRDAVLGRDLHELATPEEQAGIEAQLTVSRAGEVANVQRTMLRDDGTQVPCEMITKMLPDGRMLVLLHDVSDRLRVEEHLRRAKDAAERASLAKSSFLATMSHEIRTPMNGVLGMIDLLLDSPLQPEQREFAETARVSGEHLLDIINDILDFSKIEADRLELESIVFEPTVLVEETVALFAEQAQGKNLELVAMVAPDTPHAVRGDPSRLRQVLINLLGNAVKFTDRGEVVVRVGIDDVSGIRRAAMHADTAPDEAEPTGETPVRLWFSVADTGPGIPDSSRPRMFQAFSQGDSSTTRRFGGTGLGLAICRRLVELMGGSIDYESSADGTTFRFHLAVQRPAVVEDAALAPAHLRGDRVLVLDDNAHCRDYLVQRLETWGLTCSALGDPAATLPALREAQAQGRPFAVAFIDLDLPGVDSMALIRAATTDPELAGLRIIALSTVTRRGPGYDARGVGAVAVLSKPVRSVPLLDALIASAAGVGEAAVEPTAASAASVSFAGRVLVAEDNLVNRRLVLAQLQRLGLRADAVATGREALTVLDRADYDVVLMDGQMPDLDGFAATAELRRREGGTRHTTVVALTADALAGDRERFLAAGMDDYLAKPVRITDLAALLGRYLKPAPVPAASGAARETRSVTTHAVRAPATRTVTQRLTAVPATPPPTAPDADGIDRDRIDEILADGGLGFLGSLVDTFRGDAPRLLGAIAAALDAGELTAVIRPTHELKGAAAGLGLAALAQACLALEHAATTGMADTDRLHRELTSRYMAALEGLDRIIAR